MAGVETDRGAASALPGLLKPGTRTRAMTYQFRRLSYITSSPSALAKASPVAAPYPRRAGKAVVLCAQRIKDRKRMVNSN